MADVIEESVGVAELALIALIALIAYELYSSVKKALDNTTCDPTSFWGSIFGCPKSKVPGQTSIGQSIGGYEFTATDGKYYSCTGPKGSAGDMCTPITCDASANCTASGPAVPGNTLTPSDVLSPPPVPSGGVTTGPVISSPMIPQCYDTITGQQIPCSAGVPGGDVTPMCTDTVTGNSYPC